MSEPTFASRGGARPVSSRTLRIASARYRRAARRCLDGEGEAALAAAYELGRWAVDAGVSVLDLAESHHEALLELVGGAPAPAKAIELEGSVFLEALSAFEIAQRGCREANEVLRHLNDRLEQETKRIADSLHGEAGQLLASVHIALVALERDVPAVRDRIEDVRKILDGVESGLRRLSHELRPAMLEDLGLVPAIRFHADGIELRSKLRVLVGGSTQGRHSPQLESVLYRVVQEALQNVVRHARATQATVFFRRDQRGLHCLVADDGIGFEPAAALGKVERGMGLMGIRDRLAALGGTLEIRWGGEGRGTVLVAFVPAAVTGGADAAHSPARR